MKERALISILKDFQKLELEDLSHLLGSDISPRMKKAEMVDRLAMYLEDKPKRWLDRLMERDILLLRQLVHAGPDKVQYLDYADYPSVLEIGRLIESDDSDEHYHKVWIRREVYDIVAPHIDHAIRTGEKSGRFEIERVGLGLLNLYGVLPTDLFVDRVTDYYEARYGEGHIRQLADLLHTTPLVKLCRYTDAHGDYVCSPCVAEADELFHLREEIKDIPQYCAFSDEEILEAGAGAPYFTVSMKTPEGQALEDMLKDLGYEGFELVKVEHDIWLEAQDPVQNDALYDVLTVCEDRLGSWTAYRDCFNVISRYADIVPKWVLKGYSASETGYYLADEPAEPEWNEAPEDDGEAPRWTMPRPTISEGYTDEIETDEALDRLKPLMPQGFPFGLAIPHVAPTDPCPCGSGLRYGLCHGKHLN